MEWRGKIHPSPTIQKVEVRRIDRRVPAVKRMVESWKSSYRIRKRNMFGEHRASLGIAFLVAMVTTGIQAQTRERHDHWAFQAISRPRVPRTQFENRVNTPIDAFLFFRLEKAGLAPSPRSNRLTLHRRLSLDLLGIPPTHAEQQRFASDRTAGAWGRLADRLLSRPEFGERWGRHWLDVARYGESNGYERDGTKPNAWRFRDYVIDAFNADLSFDRFLTEQLAGDEIAGSDARSQIATTFLRLGTWDDEPADPFADRFDQLDDVLGTTTSAFLGLTLRCARCHDHKFEPLSQEDYYGILAVFSPLKRPEKIKSATHREEFDREVGSPGELETYRVQAKLADDALARFNKEKDVFLSKVRGRVLDNAAAGNDKELSKEWAIAFRRTAKQRTKQQTKLIKALSKQLQRRIVETMTAAEKQNDLRLTEEIGRAKASRPPKPPRAYIWYEDTPKAPKTRLFERGDPYQPRRAIEPGIPTVLRGEALAGPNPLEKSAGRRIWLSRWMTSRSNPLVARVYVNRVWQHLLGDGLVASESDFGEMGDVPVHQGLLDWLAADFIESGWQTKRLVKLIVSSAVYQMDSQSQASASKLDPEERLLWRFRQRRVDAEAFRDSVLSVSGQLNRSMGGPSVYPQLPDAVLAGQSRPGSGWGKPTAQTEGRRSVYIFSKRSLAVPELALLDAPNSTDSCSQRSVSTTGPQALTFLNGVFINTAATAFAERLMRESGPQPVTQVTQAFRLALCRDPSRDELESSTAFLRSQAALRSKGETEMAQSKRRALAALCLVLLNTNEFAYTR